MKKDDAIFNVLREYIKSSKKIRYEGDGYAENWEKKALRRKLSNHKTTPEALKIQLNKKTIKLFEEMEIMTEAEIRARHEIEIEEYTKHVQIESRVLGSMARNHIIPTAIRYQNMLIENVQGLKAIYEKDFKALSQQAHLIEGRQGDYERTSESRGHRDLKTWTTGMEIKKEYHEKLYGDIKAPEPLALVNNHVTSKEPQDNAPKVEVPTPQRSYSGPRP